jgi:tripartite-type tricarboxylate transporter receptor subunit TctC
MKRKMSWCLISVISTTFLVSVVGVTRSWAKDPEYPTKPITFYIAQSPGGPTDTSLRALLEPVGKNLGQPLVPVNKPGGAGLVGALAVMNSKPDGYTLGSTSGGPALVQPHLEGSPYRDLSGFTLIANFGKYLLPVLVRGDAPYKTWKEFIEWARKNPRGAKVGVIGSKVQNPNAMVLGEVEQKERVEFTMIVFKGNPEVLSALLGGHITMDTTGVGPQTIRYVQDGTLRILTYLGKEKVPGYENIPSLYELYGIVCPSIMGIWGPKGLPQYVLDKLEPAFAKGVKDPGFATVMSRMYMPVVYMNRTELEREVKEVTPKVGEMLKFLSAKEEKEKN